MEKARIRSNSIVPRQFPVNDVLVAQILDAKQRLADRFPKFAIFIPAYNAENHIEKTIQRIPTGLKDVIAEVFVFDDCSRDGTLLRAKAAVATSVCWKDRATVIRHDRNLGYGGNQKMAFRYAIERQYDFVIMVHGDGQYAPEFIPNMMAEALDGSLDAVFASRMIHKKEALAGGMPLYKWLGNQVLTSIQNSVLGMNLFEFHSGYRMYAVDALRCIPFAENTDDFHFDTQIIIQLRALGAKIKEIHVATHYGDEVCHVNGSKYARDVLLSVFEYRLHQLHILRKGRYLVKRAAHYSLKHSPYSSHEQILNMLEGSGKILDLGSAGGLLTPSFQERGFATVGIDQFASEANKHDEFHQRDLNLPLALSYNKEFDYVVAADLLEHLINRDGLLREIHPMLKDSGCLVVSTPNICNWYIRLSVLLGRFNYGEKGILDRTHVHFYTRASLINFLRRNGFEIIEIAGTSLPFEVVFETTGKSRMIRFVDALYARLVRLWPTMFAYQFVVKAKRQY